MLFCDFNVNPIVGAVAVKTEYGLHIIDEIAIYEHTDELAQEMRRRYPKQQIICSDRGHKEKQVQGKNRTSILQNAGFRVLFRSDIRSERQNKCCQFTFVKY